MSEQTDSARDWDEDGEPDNKLPLLLGAFDPFLADVQLDPTDLNAAVADMIEQDVLVLLQESTNANDVLDLDFLVGDVDVNELTVDEASSYGADGEALNSLQGAFLSERSYLAGPGDLLIPLPLVPGDPLVPFPIEEVDILEGTMDAGSADGLMVGLVPVDRFVEDVLVQVIPKEGYGGQSREELQELVETFLNTGSDVETEDGRPAVSALFSWTSVQATF